MFPMTTSETSKAIRRFLASIGQKGGRTTAKRLTPGTKQAIAKKAATTRWARERAKKKN